MPIEIIDLDSEEELPCRDEDIDMHPIAEDDVPIPVAVLDRDSDMQPIVEDDLPVPVARLRKKQR